MSADLFEDHRLLVAAAEDLIAAVRQEPKVRIEVVTQLRVRLGTLAMAHLRAEDELIVAPLAASGRLDELPEAKVVISEIREGHTVYSAHIRKWTLPAIDRDRAGYAEALVWMLDYLKTMVAREEKHLYWPALKLLTASRSQDKAS